MLESPRITKGRVVIALLTSLIIVVLAVVFKLPMAIMPALFVPVWLSVFASGEPVSPPGRRLMALALAGGLAMLAIVGVVIFAFA